MLVKDMSLVLLLLLVKVVSLGCFLVGSVLCVVLQGLPPSPCVLWLWFARYAHTDVFIGERLVKFGFSVALFR